MEMPIHFHGVTGMISFDHQGNDIRSVTFAQICNGRFVPLRDADIRRMAAERTRRRRASSR